MNRAHAAVEHDTACAAAFRSSSRSRRQVDIDYKRCISRKSLHFAAASVVSCTSRLLRTLSGFPAWASILKEAGQEIRTRDMSSSRKWQSGSEFAELEEHSLHQ